MPNHLGELEQLVLLALLRLGKSGYGVTVRQELQLRAGRNVSRSTKQLGAGSMGIARSQGVVHAHVVEGALDPEGGDQAARRPAGPGAVIVPNRAWEYYEARVSGHLRKLLNQD